MYPYAFMYPQHNTYLDGQKESLQCTGKKSKWTPPYYTKTQVQIIVYSMQLNLLWSAGHITGVHSDANSMFSTIILSFVSSFWIPPRPPSLWNSHKMFCFVSFCFPLDTHSLYFYSYTNSLSSQCKCKYIISNYKAKTHFMTLKMTFQNQSPDDSRVMISITVLLHCGDYNFTIGQDAEDAHRQECSLYIIPSNAVKSLWAENVLKLASGENRKLSKI